MPVRFIMHLQRVHVSNTTPYGDRNERIVIIVGLSSAVSPPRARLRRVRSQNSPSRRGAHIVFASPTHRRRVAREPAPAPSMTRSRFNLRSPCPLARRRPFSIARERDARSSARARGRVAAVGGAHRDSSSLGASTSARVASP